MANILQQEFETIIGLEVHLQLKTATKIFCGCANVFGAPPNSQTCPVCLGLPGTLPVLNRKALEYAIKIALALNCEINPYIKFDRKNYYYPDLPKGYQISQYDLPIGRHGFILLNMVNIENKKIRILRTHLEEDAGKLIHDDESNCSLVDYNRTGTPLMEIVSEADLRSPQEAYDYLQTLKLTLQYLNVSDCDMEKGSLRCDANISLRKHGEKKFGTKTEVKNMNSFKAVKTALEFEEHRQREALLSGQTMIQETRLWDENKNMTFPMRSKEEAHDYRYFPEPDLVPFVVNSQTIEKIRCDLPELPLQKFERLKSQYGLSEYDARLLVQDPSLTNFFEMCTKLYPDTKKICNWISGPILQELNDRKINIPDLKISPQTLTDLIKNMDEGTLNNITAKEVFRVVLETGKGINEIIQLKDLSQISDEAWLNQIAEEILSGNEKIVAQIKAGKESALGFLIGQAMKKTKGKANPQKIGELIKRRINS